MCFGVDRTGDKMTSPSSRITPAFVLLIHELVASQVQFMFNLNCHLLDSSVCKWKDIGYVACKIIWLFSGTMRAVPLC